MCSSDLEYQPPHVGLAATFPVRVTEASSDEVAIRAMRDRARAKSSTGSDYVRTILCRFLCAVAVERTQVAGAFEYRLRVIRQAGHVPVALEYIAQHGVQVAGWNVAGSDLPMLFQTALKSSGTASDYCSRPDKPWDGPDYFSRHSSHVVDLQDIVGGRPSLHEAAVALGIPGKLGTSGGDVADLWLAGEHEAIAA